MSHKTSHKKLQSEYQHCTNTIFINSCCFQNAKELPWPSCQLFLQIQWIKTCNWGENKPHLLLPGFPALLRRAGRSPGAHPKLSLCHGSSSLHSARLILPAKTAATFKPSKTPTRRSEAAFLDGGMAHTCPHSQGLDMQPCSRCLCHCVTTNTSPCSAECSARVFL